MAESGEILQDERGMFCGMKQDSKSLYKALIARDSRFDGLFFVEVTSTGIYCRPVCPVKPPKEVNCRFYNNAQEAEQAGFRPCLRCRPELAPGNAPMDDSQRIAHLVVQRIEEGVSDEKSALEAIASEFELSSRQIRRIIQKELGVPPIQLILTRRLLLAKQLLTETKLPVTEIAFASGFSSLRRFNDAFGRQYRLPPPHLRIRDAEHQEMIDAGRTSTLRLSYRPPYDWQEILKFLGARMIRDVEFVTADSYARTVRLGKRTGWIKVTHAPEKGGLVVEFTRTLVPVLPALLGRRRNLFDLTARPDLIAAHLMKDKFLKKSVTKNPGLRVPGAFDGFEMAIRAILGQQITVKDATTIAGRFAEAFGEKIRTPFPELTRLSPLAARIAKASVRDIAKLGIVGTRAASILAFARAFQAGSLKLDTGTNPEADIAALTALPGIGQWTAHYIAMRASRWPDAFPKEDIAVRNSLGRVSTKQAEQISQAWRPWRSYAVMHLWKNLRNRSRIISQRLSAELCGTPAG